MRRVRCPVVVGRSAELDLLAAAVEGAAAGAGGIVFLRGEPGMGKTRLAAETVELARSSGMAILSGRATPSPTPAPYRALAEAFGSAWRGREPPAGPAREGLRPALEILVPAWTAAGEERQPVASTVTIGEAALVLLGGLGGAGALLVVDDLQWSDPESLEVLEYLADKVSELTVLVVAAGRTGEGPGAERLAHTLAARRSAQLVALGPLDGSGVRAAVAAALGTTDPPPALVGAVGERSGGSPFLVEELLASLIAIGALVQTGTGWEVRGALPVVVPESLALAVADRLAALPAPARRVVEMAAVLGEHFDWRLVGDSVTGDVVAALRQAEESRLVEEDRCSGGFRFRHALTRTAVLGILVAPERVRLAGRALSAMGKLDATSDPDRLGLAAQLAETAGDGDRAFALRLTSSRAALRVGAVASARDAATDALRLARTPEGVVDARRALLDAGVAAADSARIIPLGTQLLDQLVALGAAEEDLAEIHHLMAAAAVTRSDWCQAAAGLDAADRCAPSPPAAITARHEALRAEVALGEHRIEAALAYAERARTAAVRAGRHDLEADALALLGRSSRLSDLGAAERWFTAALGAAELSGSALRRATALHELATIDVIGLGCTDRVRHARSLAAGIGAPGRVAATDLQLAVLHWKRHELDDSRAAAHRAVTAGQRFGLGLLVPLAHIISGLADAVAGRRDHAAAAFDLGRARGRGPRRCARGARPRRRAGTTRLRHGPQPLARTACPTAGGRGRTGRRGRRHRARPYPGPGRRSRPLRHARPCGARRAQRRRHLGDDALCDRRRRADGCALVAQARPPAGRRDRDHRRLGGSVDLAARRARILLEQRTRRRARLPILAAPQRLAASPRPRCGAARARRPRDHPSGGRRPRAARTRAVQPGDRRSPAPVPADGGEARRAPHGRDRDHPAHPARRPDDRPHRSAVTAVRGDGEHRQSRQRIVS